VIARKIAALPGSAAVAAGVAGRTLRRQFARLNVPRNITVDLKVPIVITDELADDAISATAQLNLASGEISHIQYQGYDVAAKGLPWEQEDYEFSCGTLTNNGKDVEFTVQVNQTTGQYSITATELQEIKMRAAALFSGVPSATLIEEIAPKSKRRGG
jgi:hypothetical protein